MKEEFLDRKLQERSAAGALRVLRVAGGQADYYSNDYLGIVKNGLIEGALPRETIGSRVHRIQITGRKLSIDRRNRKRNCFLS